MPIARWLVKYVEDEDENNIKTYGVWAQFKNKAIDKVIGYIDENNHHPSINYGFTLSAKISNDTADYEIPRTLNNN